MLNILLLTLALFAGKANAATCYGGPGYYPYPCPQPPTTPTCNGGPGNYPYPCPTR